MFDRYMQDKRQRRPLLIATLVLVGLAEALTVTGFLITALLKVDEVEPPPLYALLVRPVFIPPPAFIKPPSEPPPLHQTPRRNEHRHPLQQPRPQVAPAPPTEAASPAEPGDAEPVDPSDTSCPTCQVGELSPPPVVVPPPPPPPPTRPDPPPVPRKVPLFLIRKQQLTGSDPHLPAIVKQQHRGQTLTGSYLMCIDKRGQISSVTMLASIPGGDEEIRKTLQTWTYKEQLIPVCFVQNFEFVVE